MARFARPVVPPAPIESYTVVMATGIAAVAARENEHPAVALVLAVLAGCGLIAVVAWAALARAGSGRGMTCAASRVDHACALFGFVAATDVVAAQFDLSTATGVVVLLGTVAVVAWVALMIRMTAVVHTCGWAAIRAGARGSWLLVVVAAQSLVLTAARLAVVAGEASGALIVASVVGWWTGVLAYLAIVPLVVRRVVGPDGRLGDHGRRGRHRGRHRAQRRTRGRGARGGGRLLGGRDGLDPGARRRGVAPLPPSTAPLRAHAVVHGVPAGHVCRRLYDGGRDDAAHRAAGGGGNAVLGGLDGMVRDDRGSALVRREATTAS
jgi:hypothetical protein